MEPNDAASNAIEALTQRIADLESFLAGQGYRRAEMAPAELTRTVAAPMSVESAASNIPVAEIASLIASPAVERPHAMPPPLPPAKAPAAPPAPTARPAPVAYAAPMPPRMPEASSSVEQTIGLKVAGWIGAIIVVIGAAMGVKYAYDQGWLGNLPPQLKLGMLYAVALAIIGVGEWVYRKVDPRAAVGIYAAGIASLFMVGYAGSAYFHLYEQVTAFALMAIACAVGAGISLRGKSVSIAVLSHLGANLAPLILHDSTVGELPLLAYLLALQVMAVGLAHVGRGGRWWVLRTLALITTTLWMGGRLADAATAHSLPTVVFCAIYAAIFQIELVLAALHADAVTEPTARRDAGTFSAATFSLATTGALIGELLAWTADVEPPMQRGAVMIGLAMLAATAGAATLHRGGAVMRSLATSWLTQAALLLVIAIPVALHGPAATVAWAALATAYAVLGLVLRRSRTVAAGAGVWVIATLQLFAATATGGFEEPLRVALWTIGGVPVPIYLMLAIVLGIAGHVIALIAGSKRLRGVVNETAMPLDAGRRRSSGLAKVMAIAGTGAWIVAVLAALPALSATGSLLAIGWIVVALGRFAGRSAYAAIGLSVVTLALAKWTAVDILGENLGLTTAATPLGQHLFFNAPIAVGTACAASLLVMLWIGKPALRESADEQAGWVLFSWFAIVFSVVALTIGLSVEVERAASLAADRGSLAWPPMQATMFGWTVLGLAAAQLLPILGRTIDGSPQRLRIAGQVVGVVTILIAAKFVAIDAIGFMIDAPRVASTPGLNLETLAAAAVLAALLASFRFDERRSPLATALRAAIFAVPLVVGSIELDRAFGPERTLVAWSAFWGAYAIVSIVIGFARTSAALRFAGLGLLGITLLKIVLVDLASASTGWRILSFLAVGVVLLATSVLYGKLSPKLLGEAKKQRTR